MQKEYFLTMEKLETGRTVIFQDQKNSKPPERRFFHSEKPRNRRNGDFFTSKNLHTDVMKVFQHQKVSIPPVSTFFNGKKPSGDQFRIFFDRKNLYPHCIKTGTSPVHGRRFVSSVFVSDFRRNKCSEYNDVKTYQNQKLKESQHFILLKQGVKNERRKVTNFRRSKP